MSKKAALNLILEISKFTGAILVIIFGLVFAQAAKTAMAQSLNFLNVTSVVSGVPISGSQGGTSGSTNYTIATTSDINTTLTAPLSFGGRTFLNWSGCSSSGNQCFAVVTGGANYTVTANYAAAPPPSAITVDLKIDRQDGTPGPVTVNEGGTVNVTWDVTPTGLSPINCIASGFFSGTPWTGWSGLKSYPTGTETISVPSGSLSGSLRLACTISATEGGYDEVFFNVVKPAIGVELFANDQRPTLTISGPGNVTLRWATTNLSGVNSPICQGDWKPGVLLNADGGTEVVNVTVSTTYTIKCQRLGSPDSSSSVSVVIGGPPPPPPPPAGGFSRLDFCLAYGDIVATIGFPSVPKPPALVNAVQIAQGSPGSVILTIDPWPANEVKVAGIFAPGVTYFFKGILVIPPIDLSTSWVSITPDASTPPCIAPPPPPPPPPPPTPPVVTGCSEPKFARNYTKVSVEPLPEQVITIQRDSQVVPIGSPPPQITITRQDILNINPNYFTVKEDMSKLAAIFANSNSNYLESNFQDQSHRGENIIGLNSQDFNEYHKAGQKAAPIYMTDDLRMNYVSYINGKPSITEAVNTFSDYNGANAQTIAQLVTAYGQPNPPSHGGNQATWDTTWGMYWSKIPTAVNEFYLGWVEYGVIRGNDQWNSITNPQPGDQPWCPGGLNNKFFIVRDYFRNASIVNQINQIIVPKEAQSSTSNFAQTSLDLNSPIDHVKAWLEEVKDQGVVSAVKKIFKISFSNLMGISDVYAQTGEDAPTPPGPESCPKPIPVLPNDKPGGGPFCPFPDETGSGSNRRSQYVYPGESCVDHIHCTFIVPFINQVLNVPIHTANIPNDPDWDASCTDIVDNAANTHYYSCSITFRISRTYYFPWISNVWNNSTYSDTADSVAITGPGINGPGGQRTGRPGLMSFFTPKATEPTIHPQGKNLPGSEGGSSGPETVRQRFFGAVDCAKNFVRDNALKPLALQGYLAITLGCPWR